MDKGIGSIKISVPHARRLALHSQLLDNRTNIPRGKEGVVRIIETLGYVQIDTIAVIERAHHHTLWTRRGDYHENMLHELQAVDRRIFEYWGHEASYLPISDYRYYLPLMRRYRTPRQKWEQYKYDKCKHLLEPVLERIRREGALTSSDFQRQAGDRRGSWWDWKPAKIALEFLFWRGELMIAERRQFKRVYDLTERVLPEGIDTTYPNPGETGRFFVRRALQGMGIARENEICDYLRACDKVTISRALQELVEAGEVLSCEIDGANSTYYALPVLVEKTSRFRRKRPAVHVLSPFDGLVIQRDRTRRLFDFDYTIECYVPAAKRKYGYFVLPILWDEQFAGRFDVKADRETETLLVHNLVFEPNFDDFERFLPAFLRKLEEFAAFNQCHEIRFGRVQPGKVRKKIQALH